MWITAVGVIEACAQPLDYWEGVQRRAFCGLLHVILPQNAILSFHRRKTSNQSARCHSLMVAVGLTVEVNAPDTGLWVDAGVLLPDVGIVIVFSRRVCVCRWQYVTSLS